jgi:hypothetical protein
MAMKRRTFIKTGAVGALLGQDLGLGAGAGATGRARVLTEPARDIPVAGTYDVVVCGAGPAGVCAAIAAGRAGARTLLLEAQGCLGGIWTAGLLCWILDGRNKRGVIREIVQSLERRGAGFGNRGGNGAFAYDPEIMKLRLEELCLGAGVHLRLHTAVRAAHVEQRRLRLAVTESKSGRQAWRGGIFIDSTGDGDLAAQAGCGFDFGRSRDGAAQPMSLLALIAGLRYDAIERYVRRPGEAMGVTKARLLAEIERGGHSPSYRRPGIYPIYDDLFMLMANHEYEVSGLDAGDVTRATLQARGEVFRIVESLRSLGGCWQDLRIVATGEQIGVREGRRIHGRYTVTREDLVRGARFEDAVCRVTFGVDVHSVKREQEGQGYSRGVRSRAYDIPQRSLIARDVDGLMMAGRCISGDFIAHSSYRVTGNAAALGEAAGRIAARAVEQGVLPQAVSSAANARILEQP